MHRESMLPTERPTPLRRTVLFSDVVQSTAMVDGLGDAAWLAVIDRHTAAVGAAASAHGGIVDNFLGDGFMVVFERPADAVACALELQHHATTGGELVLRIGVDHGDVFTFRDSWLIGRTIHIASRLTDLCPDGGVALSDRVADLAEDALPQRSIDVRLVAVRGLSEPCLVHVVDPVEFVATAVGHPSATPTASSAP